MSNQSRHPSGVPTGGQFAASARTESGVQLGEHVHPGEDGETLVREFSCEHHDAPGECTPACVELVSQMDTNLGGVEYDPSGCSYGPERPYRTYEYDEQARASICVTHVPEGEALVRALQPGQWVYVDGEPRKVDAVAPARVGRVHVDFEGFDRDEHDEPEAYFIREFRADETLEVVEPGDIPQH